MNIRTYWRLSMVKAKGCLILLGFLFLLSGCGNQSNVSGKTISFEYFFKGFMTLKKSQAEAYPHDSFVIEKDEDWHDFMDKYVPGIPYYTSVDYSKEALVFSVIFPAKPTYSCGSDIKTFTDNENRLEPVYKDTKILGISNGIYVQNVDDLEHCYVNIVKVAKKDIPKDICNIYHKGDIVKN